MRAAISTNTGFLIFALQEQGTAKKARLMVGDILIDVNGKEPQTIRDLSNAVGSRRIGETVSVCVLRGEAIVEMQIENPE